MSDVILSLFTRNLKGADELCLFELPSFATASIVEQVQTHNDQLLLVKTG